MNKKTTQETFTSYKVQGEDLLKEIKDLLHEGNVRKIVIKDEKGQKTYVEIPVTIGVIGTLIAPVLAAIGALAAMVGVVTIELINDEKKGAVQKKSSPAMAFSKGTSTRKKVAKNSSKKEKTSRKR